MEMFYRIIALFGGLAMFLYGMRMMGDALKASSGGAMKAALAKVTNRPVMGFIFGMLVTAMIQSSTATIVLTVGLVGAGFLTFRQSTGIVLGANVGTAITAQIIRLMDVESGSGNILYFFKADNLAPLALIIGIILIMFIKSDRSNNTGAIFVGFGVLFTGLISMSGAVGELESVLSRLLTAFEGNYFFGFLSGVVVTGIIQSSSAVVGILQSMASSVGVRFCGVFAVIIGVNIGDCITTFIVSRIGAKPEQTRTATVHVIYNIMAASLIIIVLLILRLTGVLNDDIWYMSLKSGGVANVHGLFRIVPAIVLLPFSNFMARIAERLVPDTPKDSEDLQIEESLRALDSRLVDSPKLALDQVEQIVYHMADVANHNYDGAVDQIFAYDIKRKDRIEQREVLLDRMADATNQYLIEVTPHITMQSQNLRQDYLIKLLTSFERLGDHAVNISKDISQMKENDAKFSDTGMSDLRIACDAIDEILELTGEAFKKESVTLAKKVEPLEEVIDTLIGRLRSRHISRMTHGKCNIYSGIRFENILSNLERISDMCSDVALSILAQEDNSIIGHEHQYVYDLHHSDDPEYLAEYNAKREKYMSRFAETQPEPAKA